MAKKAKTKRAKAATSKARRPKARAPAITPTYLPEGRTYTMGLHDVVRALKVIEKHGQMAKFVKAAKEKQAAATFDAKTVNFVKDFLVKHKMHTDPIGNHIVNAEQARPVRVAARRSGRFNCNFGNR
jgi:hypothetical protein